ncbi:hypothetical protein BMS3Abin03_01944 [bacterium BMS3Abin03]|nr:hypothetical protein BMS3Abin03_01944 [bacterium BMS3Abin03]
MRKLIAAVKLTHLFEDFTFADSHLLISFEIKDRHIASAQICVFENKDYIEKGI